MGGSKNESHVLRTIGLIVLLLLCVPVVLMTAIFIAPIVMVSMPIFIAWSVQKGGAAERHRDDSLPAATPATAH